MLQTAERVRAELVQATKEHLLQLEDAVVVEHRADGKIKLHQAMSLAGAGAAGGALWGGLIGLLFLAPLLGMAIGAASGALAGKMTDTGVDDDFLKNARRQMPPGGAALIVLGRAGAPDKVIERLRPYGGDADPDVARRRSRGAAARRTRRAGRRRPSRASSTVRRVPRRAVAAPVRHPQAAQQPRRQPVLLHDSAARRTRGPGARALRLERSRRG